MKKRITCFALVLVMLFAFSAWAAPRLSITTASIPEVTKGGTVSVTLETEKEDIEDTLTWTVDTATQGGITFDDGAFSGTAGKVGSYTFRVTATGTYTDDNGEKKTVTATRSYTIRVKALAPGDIAVEGVTDDDLATLEGFGSGGGDVKGLLVGTTPTAYPTFKTKATLPVTYTVTGLPAGIKYEFDGDNEEGDTDEDNNVQIKLSGTPTRAGIYSGIMVNITNSSGTSKSGPYTLKVFEKAKITTKKIPDITWGKEYSFTLATTGGLGSDYPLTWDADVITTDKLTGAGLTGFTFDPDTGTISGTLETADKDNENLKFGDSKDITISLSFKAKSPIDTEDANSDTVVLPITVKAAAPTITNKADAQYNFDNAGFTISNEDGKITPADTELPFEVKGPGTITWSVSRLPDGFVSVDATESEPFKIKSVSDTIGQTVKRLPISVTAKNGAGADMATFYMNIDVAEGGSVKIGGGEEELKLPEGIFKVGDSVDSDPVETTALPGMAGRLPSNKKATGQVALYAYPGPIAWSATGLPMGIKLSIDKSVSFDTKAYLIGGFKKETKKDVTYKITATNKTYGTKDTIEKKLTVYDEPNIKTNSLPQYTIGNNYNAKINVAGLDATVLDVTFALSGDNEALPASKRASYPAEPEDEYFLTFNKNKMAITGTLNKLPATPDANDKYLVTLNATIIAANPAFSGDQAIQKVVPIKIKGTPPKFTTSKIDDFEGTGDNADESGANHIIVVTGAQPMTITACITSADAKKLSLNDGTKDIAITVQDAESGALPATKKAEGEPEFVITKRVDGTTTKLLLGYAADQGLAFTGVPITITADNGTTKEPIKKVYKVNVTGASPAIYSGDVADDGVLASKDIIVEATAGTPLEKSILLTASGDKPLEFTTAPKIGTTKNGLTATVEDGKLTISGTPTAKKETSTVFNVTLTNPLTKKKATRKVTIKGLVVPEITSKGSALTKVIEVGKSINFKLAAKGSKTITWSLAEEDITKISDDLGLSFDAKTGTIKGTATGATADENGLYSPIEVTFTASNKAGDSEPVKAIIGVKGRKPKMVTKTITFQVLSSDQSLSGDATLKTDMASSDTSANVKWGLYGGKTTVKPLTNFKVKTSDTRNYGEIDVNDLKSPMGVCATKGANLKVSADNIGTAINANIKIIIKDPEPTFKSDSPAYNNTGTPLTLTSHKTSARTRTVNFELEDWAMTGDTGMKWVLSSKPSGKVTAAIKTANKNKSATVTVTVSKGLSSADIPAKDKKDGKTTYSTSFTVIVTNTSTNVSKIHTVSIDVTPYDAGSTSALPEDKDALPEEPAEETAEKEEAAEEEVSAEDEEELAAGEGTVTYGRARSESGLTHAERSMLAEGGYIIAAILPEITTDASGQYDLDVVSLDEAAAEGAELVWFAFPRNAESTEDDSIAEFYDEAGAEIYAVPESKKVVVSPWLEAEVTYAPVIAVKAPVAGDAKTSLDDAEAGDTVTEQAIENAAETPEEK